mmetsp:Transcript_10341/g.19075  ORF Transcript_10341/g.19075 Transcript_10341/m.19075 type:complete len:169 (-) Transcript_10341:270-776(-)
MTDSNANQLKVIKVADLTRFKPQRRKTAIEHQNELNNLALKISEEDNGQICANALERLKLFIRKQGYELPDGWTVRVKARISTRPRQSARILSNCDSLDPLNIRRSLNVTDHVHGLATSLNTTVRTTSNEYFSPTGRICRSFAQVLALLQAEKSTSQRIEEGSKKIST